MFQFYFNNVRLRSMEEKSNFISNIEGPKFNKPENTQNESHKFVVDKPTPSEFPEEYLKRMRWRFAKSLFPNDKLIKKHLNEADKKIALEHAFLSQIFSELKAMESNRIKQSEVKNRIVYQKLQRKIHSSFLIGSTHRRDDLNEMHNFFASTRRNRDFYPKAPNSINGDGDSYYDLGCGYMVLGVPSFLINTPEAKNYIHSRIDNKNIYIFGGGNSLDDLILGDEYKPKSIINIDPYLAKENIDKNSKNKHLYRSILISAADKKLVEIINRENLPKVDEIWATYSVPCYLESIEEIQNLINNIEKILAPNGNAHIYPISLLSKTDNEETFEMRKKTLLDSLDKLMDNNEFNVTVANQGIHIHRLNK